MRTLIFFVEWSCTKVIINGRGPQILMKWLYAYKKNKKVSTLSLCRMVLHKRNNKYKKTTYFGQMVVCTQKK